MHKSSFCYLFLFLLFVGCRQDGSQQGPSESSSVISKTYSNLKGKTMGTTWHVTYAGNDNEKHQKNIDSILIRLNEEVSTYIPSAIISQFNQSEKGVEISPTEHGHFLNNYKAGLEIYKKTKGQFDPTVMPLVNYWGFGYTGRDKVREANEQKVKKILAYVGLDHVSLSDEGYLSKDNPNVQIDFSALAKGYGVDEICRYFDGGGVRDYFVEIGGEVRTKGKNPRGELWTIGISRPERESAPNDFYMTIKLKDKGIATSGNYRNVYTVDGVHYFHTIDPVTGYPKGDRLLSASVIADNCMTADAYATAFMVMGLEKAMIFAKENPELGVCFIYNTDSGDLELYSSEDMKAYVKPLAY